MRLCDEVTCAVCSLVCVCFHHLCLDVIQTPGMEERLHTAVVSELEPASSMQVLSTISDRIFGITELLQSPCFTDKKKCCQFSVPGVCVDSYFETFWILLATEAGTDISTTRRRTAATTTGRMAQDSLTLTALCNWNITWKCHTVQPHYNKTLQFLCLVPVKMFYQFTALQITLNFNQNMEVMKQPKAPIVHFPVRE